MSRLARMFGVDMRKKWPRSFSYRLWLFLGLICTVVLYRQISRQSGNHNRDENDDQYSKTLVVASYKREYTAWVNELANIEPIVYVIDDQNATFKPPETRGRESMVYLTYIIDNYENLPEIAVFVHGDDRSWHNEETMEGRTSIMLDRLNWDHVLRQGYFNLRCAMNPGCPHWLDLSGKKQRSEINTEEAEATRRTWKEIHGGDPMPDMLSQPCCSQFAASRNQIRSVPLSRWKHYQTWMLDTSLEDGIVARIWEYTWQYVLAGTSELCPDVRACLCQGYKICFGSRTLYEEWLDVHEKQESLVSDILSVRKEGGNDPDLELLLRQTEAKERKLLGEAKSRGLDSRQRAREL